MRKKFQKFPIAVLLLAACCVAPALSSCSSDPEAEAEIERLAIRNEAMRRTVDSLHDEVEILKAQTDSVKNELKSLDMHK
ncbi:MAG: hypothetical protein IKN70_10680 [Fibrobacter sp.]|nr:hypothetical protein [Fibrobacter sp.]